MLDRNDLDRRVAEHHARVARAESHAWEQQAQTRGELRARVARLLLALATRLAPAERQPTADLSPSRRAATPPRPLSSPGETR